MCGGKKKISQGQKDQALSSRIRQSDYDMVGRIDRGLRARKLISPQEIGQQAYNKAIMSGKTKQAASYIGASAETKASISETPTYGEEI